jgi:hypothetical protein
LTFIDVDAVGWVFVAAVAGTGVCTGKVVAVCIVTVVDTVTFIYVTAGVVGFQVVSSVATAREAANRVVAGSDVIVAVISASNTLVDVDTDRVIDKKVSVVARASVAKFVVVTCSATHVGDKVETELGVAVAFVDVGTFDSGTFVKFVAFAGKASVVVRTGGVVVTVVGVVIALIDVATTNC